MNGYAFFNLLRLSSTYQLLLSNPSINGFSFKCTFISLLVKLVAILNPKGLYYQWGAFYLFIAQFFAT